MKYSIIESLAIERMESGHKCLNLTNGIGWEDFPAFAEQIVVALGAKVTLRNDMPDVRLWVIEADGIRLRLVFDDFPAVVTLESSSAEADSLIEHFYSNWKASLQ